MNIIDIAKTQIINNDDIRNNFEIILIGLHLDFSRYDNNAYIKQHIPLQVKNNIKKDK